MAVVPGFFTVLVALGSEPQSVFTLLNTRVSLLSQAVSHNGISYVKPASAIHAGA